MKPRYVNWMTLLLTKETFSLCCKICYQRLAVEASLPEDFRIGEPEFPWSYYIQQSARVSAELKRVEALQR